MKGRIIKGVASLLLVLVVVSCVSVSCGLSPTREEIQAEIFDLVNQARIENGLEPVTIDQLLEKLAEEHCKWLSDKDIDDIDSVNAHEGIDDRAAIIYAAGHNWMGENVVWGQSARSMVNWWLSSPGHRANMLDPRWRYTGLYYSNGYCVQIFAD